MNAPPATDSSDNGKELFSRTTTGEEAAAAASQPATLPTNLL